MNLDDQTRQHLRALGAVQQWDQTEATMLQMARAIAAYYTALTEGGVPTRLAAELTSEWHRKLLWPDTLHARLFGQD